MRVLFMGSMPFSVPILHALVQAGHSISALYTQNHTSKANQHSPVQTAAQDLNLVCPVRRPTHFKDPLAVVDFHRLMDNSKTDCVVVAAYGLILPRAILHAPPLGCVNVHPSLLPRWRGAAPIERAIMAGDTNTAVAIMRMAETLDTGAIFATAPYAIKATDTAGDVHRVLGHMGGDLLVQVLAAIENKTATPIPQSEQGVCIAKKIQAQETAIDWQQSAQVIDCQIRGLSPVPGAWTHPRFDVATASKRQDRRLRLLHSRVIPCAQPQAGRVVQHKNRLFVECGQNSVEITRAQRAGKQAMPIADLLRGWTPPTHFAI